MTTKKATKGDRVATFVACNVETETYQVFENKSLADVEKELNATRSSAIGRAPDYQVFEVPRKIHNLYGAG
jgi:hypothetical protein